LRDRNAQMRDWGCFFVNNVCFHLVPSYSILPLSLPAMTSYD